MLNLRGGSVCSILSVKGDLLMLVISRRNASSAMLPSRNSRSRSLKSFSTSSWICLCWGSRVMGCPKSWSTGLGCSSARSTCRCLGYLAGERSPRGLHVELEADRVAASLRASRCILRSDVEDVPWGPKREWMLRLEGCSCGSPRRGPNLDCMLTRGPNRECTLLIALRRESTLSRGPSRDCIPPDCSVWLIGCLPGRWRKGSSSSFVLLRDSSSGARRISVRRKSWFTKVVCCARALVNSITCRDKCCSPLKLDELERNAHL